MASEFRPQPARTLVFRSFALNFRMMWTFTVLGILCFTAPFLLLIAAMTLIGTDNIVSGIVLLLIALVTFFVAYAYFFTAITLAVWLRLTGVRARVLQIVRRLRGKVAWQAILVGFRVGLTVAFGYLLLIVPGFIWYSKYVMAVPAVVIEQVYGRAAMDRSEDLAEGHRWRLVGALFFFFVIYEGIVLAAQFGVAPLLIALGLPEQTATIVQGIASILTLLLLPSSLIFPVLVYFDVRNRKEAFSLTPIGDVDTAQAAGSGI